MLDLNADIARRRGDIENAQREIDEKRQALSARERSLAERQGEALGAYVARTLAEGRDVLLGKSANLADLDVPSGGTEAHRQMANQIIRAGQIRRGEISADELPPGAVDAAGDGLAQQRRATAAQIILAGRKRRGEA